MSSKSKEGFAELLKKPDDVTQAIQGAVRDALIDHHKAGVKVPTMHDGEVVWVAVNEKGEYAE